MTVSSTKTLSPAELAKLEHAFATDPASEAYKPLAEAYLGMGRFMEAMVVCKKGVKAHPTMADPRVLLARVYAEQGKDKKALEELQGALQVAPTDKQALRLSGALQMKGGELDTGKANLLKAFELDPADAETKSTMIQWKVDAPTAAPPPAPPPPPAAVAPPLAASKPGNGTAPASHQPPVLASSPAAPASARASAAPPAPKAAVSRPAQARPTAPAKARRPAEEEEDEDDDAADRIPASRRQVRPGQTKLLFFVLLIGLPIGLGAYWGIGRYVAIKNREISKLLNAAEEQLRHDSFDSYKKACEAADQVLDLDTSSTRAHGFLAYAYAIRWGEHGDLDAQDKAVKHLESAKKGGGESSAHLLAAEALVKTYSAKGGEALKFLEGLDKRGPLLNLTMGLVQMNNGDLEHARESLDQAQTGSAGDPRIYAALGNLFRRRGQDTDAYRSFDFALRYQTDHHEALLGKAFLILEQESPDRGYVAAAKMLEKLTDASPPPSKRQLATAYLLRALLISRVSSDLALYSDEAFRKELSEGTKVTNDKEKGRAQIAKSEEDGFALDRNNPELLLVKARRLYYENSYEAAAKELREAIKLDGTRAHYHVELARALMKKQGGEKEAEDALKKALGMMPESPKLQAMLGEVYARQNKMEEAIAQYERAIKDPKAKNPEARFALGRIYRDSRKDFDKSAAAFEQAAKEFVGNTTRVGESFAELGLTREAKGDRAKAAEAFQLALNADVNGENAYFFYGRFLASEAATRGQSRQLLAEYVKRAPRGEYVAEAQRLSR